MSNPFDADPVQLGQTSLLPARDLVFSGAPVGQRSGPLNLRGWWWKLPGTLLLLAVTLPVALVAGAAALVAMAAVAVWKMLSPPQR